jgi:hypothetical protein
MPEDLRHLASQAAIAEFSGDQAEYERLCDLLYDLDTDGRTPSYLEEAKAHLHRSNLVAALKRLNKAHKAAQRGDRELTGYHLGLALDLLDGDESEIEVLRLQHDLSFHVCVRLPDARFEEVHPQRHRHSIGDHR